MIWTLAVALIGLLWLIGKVSVIKFGGMNLILLMAASMFVLAETIIGRRILKKTNAVFAYSTPEKGIQNCLDYEKAERPKSLTRRPASISGVRKRLSA